MRKACSIFARILTVIFTAVCVTSAPFSAYAQEDAPPEWAKEHFDALDRNGITESEYLVNYSYSSYEAPILRGDFCQILVNIVQSEMLPSQHIATPPRESGFFSDISDTVSDTQPGGVYNMYYAAAYGISEGSNENGVIYADINGRLTREQAAKMMCSAIGFLESSVLGGKISQVGEGKTFNDASHISSWAAPYVDRAAAMGIIIGDENSNFNPQGTVTLSEAAVMASRLMNSATALRKDKLSEHGMRYLGSQSSFFPPYGAYTDGDSIYLIAENDGYTILWESNDGIYTESFSSDGTSLGVRTLPAELPTYIAFLEADNAFYIAYGQNNREELDSKEVYRIVKYDRSWNRLGAASILGGESNTTISADATAHSEMAINGDTLVLHTSRERYRSSDGLNHQSNFTAKIRTTDMSVLEVSPSFPENHVSHSFAQNVIFADGAPVYADLGDAYPRGYVINQADGTSQTVMKFFGKIGNNTINATLGGLAASNDNYFLMGASAPQTDAQSWISQRQNAVLIVTPKNGFPNSEPKIHWLTNFSDGENYVSDTKLAAINNNTIVAMWQEKFVSSESHHNKIGDFCYAVFDGSGNQIGETKRLPDYRISISNIVLKGSTLMWARPDVGADTSTYRRTSAGAVVYSLDINSNQTTSSANVKFSVSPATLNLMERQKPVKLEVRATGISGDMPAITYTSSDYNIARADQSGNISAYKAGKATITASMKYRGVSYSDTCDVTVTQATPLSFSVKPSAATLKVGESIKIKAVVEPAELNPTVYWQYSQNSGTLSDMEEYEFTYTATKEGSDKFIAMATDSNNRQYTAQCTITVVGSNSSNTDNTDNAGNTGNTGSFGSTGNSGSFGSTGSTGSFGNTGSTGASNIPITPVVEEPYEDTVYREIYPDGHYMQVKVVGNDRVEFSGIMEMTSDIYNYAVVANLLRYTETPFVNNKEFSVVGMVDLELVKRAQDNNYDYGLTALICQHYTPGDGIVAGISFRNARINLIPDGDGYKFYIKPRS